MKECIHSMYCSMPKGTCQAEVTSNSEKMKSIAQPLSSYAFLKALVSESVTVIKAVELIIFDSNLLEAFWVIAEGIFGIG